MSKIREITYCEVCDNADLIPVMNLGEIPLPDQLVPIGHEPPAPRYPTEILWCNTCKTAHQRWVIPNKEVFPTEYHFRSANTKDVLTGMQSLVDAVEKHGLVKGLKVLDIGCNDGSLLDAFASRGAICYGIEPTDAAQEAAAKGHHVDQAYLDVEEAISYVRRNGHPDLITFVNVFAHIENLPALLANLAVIRGPETRLVIENHYLGSVIERHQFDTFYHEHPRTYSYSSFAYIAQTMGMHIEWVEFPKRYGGNIRVFLYPGTAPMNPRYLATEEPLLAGMQSLAGQVAAWQKNKRAQVVDAVLQETGGGLISTPIPAAAMPGRATVLFNLLGLDVDYISGVYEVPRSKKIGHYVPGTRIPILSDDDFPWFKYQGPVLNMAWHIADEIHERWWCRGFEGPFIQAIDPGDFV